MDKIIQIQHSLIADTDIQLMLPHRRYVHQGEVLLAKNMKERLIILFNDLLICTKKKGKFLHIDFTEPLETLKVADMKDGEYRQFRLYSSSKEYVIISDDKHQWIKVISETIKHLKSPTDNENKNVSGSHIEGTTREFLVNRIISWSKMEDANSVIKDIKELASILEKQ